MAAIEQQQSIFVATVAFFMAHALNTFYCRRVLGTRGNPDTMMTGCVWTGEFDLNTLRVLGKFLNPERKSCGFKNIWTCVVKGKVKSAYGPMWPTRPELIPVSVA